MGGGGGRGVEKLIRRKSLTCAAVVDATERGVQDDRGRAPLRLLQLRAYRPRLVDNPQKAFFQRASRTDKGVSALKMVVSLKVADEEGWVQKVNQHLPPDIRLQAMVRVTKGGYVAAHGTHRAV